MTSNPSLLFFLFLLLTNSIFHAEADFFKSLEEELQSMKDRLSARAVAETFQYTKDTPKSISIHCPCKESPVVSVREMDLISNSQECMQVKVSGANFEFAFSVNCDGESASTVRSGSGDRGADGDIDIDIDEDDEDEEEEGGGSETETENENRQEL